MSAIAMILTHIEMRKVYCDELQVLVLLVVVHGRPFERRTYNTHSFGLTIAKHTLQHSSDRRIFHSWARSKARWLIQTLCRLRS